MPNTPRAGGYASSTTPGEPGAWHISAIPNSILLTY
jgi:hypothetical protein